ncbi:BEN domain-containing protein [Caenorhabditis elegans]|uniref:BEN domain-containing protein n=1 Tax=Caenorhabditis elegans TaxID=6239 RepID=O44716_CAEEL|nr:BEN domain-containing protein [Caenorhabditis elegans]CCD67471.1 BEN domain-containing protein [Caenorhabditis elegans]|eukprot:NP_494629.1 Uncharacterized protein CELE_C46E10.3 [Caenorhabditis elegans]
MKDYSGASLEEVLKLAESIPDVELRGEPAGIAVQVAREPSAEPLPKLPRVIKEEPYFPENSEQASSSPPVPQILCASPNGPVIHGKSLVAGYRPDDRTPANTPPRLYIPPNIYTPANGPLFQAEPRDLEREDLLRQIDVFRQQSFQTAQNYQLVLTDNRTLLSRTDQLEQANTRLTSQVKSLSSENEAVKEQRDRATRRAQSLKKENQRLRELFPSAVEMVNGRPEPFPQCSVINFVPSLAISSLPSTSIPATILPKIDNLAKVPSFAPFQISSLPLSEPFLRSPSLQDDLKLAGIKNMQDKQNLYVYEKLVKKCLFHPSKGDCPQDSYDLPRFSTVLKALYGCTVGNSDMEEATDRLTRQIADEQRFQVAMNWITKIVRKRRQIKELQAPY